MPKRTFTAQSQPYLRWIVLIILSFAGFSYYYSYDIPVALQRQLQDYYKLNAIKYNLLYSVYAYPNFILPFINGVLTDIFGFNRVILVTFILTVVGDGIFYSGFLINDIDYGYFLMLFGRIMYGIGAESFSMLVTPLIYSYFKHSSLSLSLGLYFSITRIGSAINLGITYKIYELYDISFPVLIGFCLLCLSLILLIILIIYRVQHKHYLLRAHTFGSITSDDVWNIPLKSKSKSKSKSSEDIQKQMIVDDINSNYKALLLSQQLPITNYTSAVLSVDDEPEPELEPRRTNTQTTYNTYTNTCIASSMILIVGNDEQFKLSDILSFDIRFWLLILNCCVLSGTVIPFMNIGSSYLQNTYNYSQQNGNILLIIPSVICAIFTPIFGIFIDNFGGRCQWLLLSSIILCLSHFLIGYNDIGINTSYYPIIGFILIGIAYSSFSAIIWPAFALVVEPKLLGTAYGLNTSIYNVILATFYLIVGLLIVNKKDINDSDDSLEYKNVNIFLMSLSVFSIFTVCLLWYFDKKYQKYNQLQNTNNNDQLLA